MTTISEQLAVIGGAADTLVASLSTRVAELNSQAVLDDATIAHLRAALDALGQLYLDYVAAAQTRSLLVLGAYRPDASTTGVLPGSTLTIATSHTPVTGQTYHDLDVRCAVTPGPLVGNVTYINCIFRGPATAPTGTSSLYTMFRPHQRSFTFVDCTFAPQTPSPWWVGLQGYGFRLLRCDLSGVVDQVEVFNTNTGEADGPSDVIVEQCYFHDSAYWAPGVAGEVSKDGSHSDGIQWEGTTGLVVRGCYFTGQLAPAYQPNHVGGTTANSAMMVKPDVGKIAGAVIEQNWLGGGAVTINVADAPAKNRVIDNLGSLSRNRFYRDQMYTPTAIKVQAAPALHAAIGGTFDQNVFDDNGAAVPVVRTPLK
ncbi:MAG TPA: hypothetical protein VIL68_11870 [Propionibacteriaceae bacterium]